MSIKTFTFFSQLLFHLEKVDRRILCVDHAEKLPSPCEPGKLWGAVAMPAGCQITPVLGVIQLDTDTFSGRVGMSCFEEHLTLAVYYNNVVSTHKHQKFDTGLRLQETDSYGVSLFFLIFFPSLFFFFFPVDISCLNGLFTKFNFNYCSWSESNRCVWLD